MGQNVQLLQILLKFHLPSSNFYKFEGVVPKFVLQS